MPVYPSVDESLDRLPRAGQSVGDSGTAARRVVPGQQPAEPVRLGGGGV